MNACRKALETGNLNYVLIWIPEESEPELRAAFDRTLRARKGEIDSQKLADDWFFETTVRLHRAGEGVPYTGLKPAGLDEGPVVPRADRAIASGDSSEPIQFILHKVQEDLEKRFRDVMDTKKYEVNDVKAGRAFIEAYINFVVYAHHLYMSVAGGQGQEGSEKKGHSHGHT